MPFLDAIIYPSQRRHREKKQAIKFRDISRSCHHKQPYLVSSDGTISVEICKSNQLRNQTASNFCKFKNAATLKMQRKLTRAQ